MSTLRQRAREGGGGGGLPELIRKARLLTFPFFPVPLSPDHDHLFADLVTTIEHELEHPLSPPRLPSPLSRVR